MTPNVWSGRASQEVFVDLASAVLHQCIRSLIGACCAPDHHGYQRACVLITGQASMYVMVARCSILPAILILLFCISVCGLRLAVVVLLCLLVFCVCDR